MSLTVTITAQQLACCVKEMLTPEQSDLMEQLLSEVSPRTTFRALEFIGKNGCGYHGTPRDGDLECIAIAEFIGRCYERFPADRAQGAAIRAAIKSAITENDKKDNQ